MSDMQTPAVQGDVSGAAAGPDGEVVVEVEGLEKSFGKLKVLKGIDFTIRRGETIAVIGPSGSGKSTLCRTIMGLETFDRGAIALEGEIFVQNADGRGLAYGRDYRRRRLAMGMVFQHFTLFPQLTVRQNVELGPSKVLGVPPAVVRERAEAVLARVGLADKMDAFPAHISGGQKQRAAIARELAMDRRIIMFDEVTSALDPELVHEVLQAMRELALSGMTMLVVTHEMGFARNVANRVVFMDQGLVVESGAPADLLERPQHQRTKTFLQHVL